MNLLPPQLAPKTHDPIETARDWLDELGHVALATVVFTWGSSPVPVGGQLVVSPDGRFEGSVSGGCVEAEVKQPESRRQPLGLNERPTRADVRRFEAEIAQIIGSIRFD